MEREEVISQAAERGGNEADVIQKHKNGHDIYVRTTYKVLKDDNGRITKFIAINKDISEKYKAEVALRESEEKFFKIFKDNPAPIIITSLDGRIVDVNESCLRITGYSYEELTSGSFPVSKLYYDPTEREHLINLTLLRRKVISRFILLAPECLSVFELKYFDNGKPYSFDIKPCKLSGVGLQNIKNRVYLINAKLSPIVKDGKTIVRILKPLDQM